MLFMLERSRELTHYTQADNIWLIDWSKSITLVLWGFGLFWLVNAAATVISLRIREKVRFNMGWWG